MKAHHQYLVNSVLWGHNSTVNSVLYSRTAFDSELYNPIIIGQFDSMSNTAPNGHY